MRRILVRSGIGLAVAAVAALGYVAVDRPTSAEAALSGCHSDGKHYEVCFTDPKNGKGKVIENRLGQLVDSAKKGDTIRIALYMWTREPLAEKVATAYTKRHVDVQLVLDEKVTKAGGAYRILKKHHVPMTLCHTGHGSCLSTHINHNKFFLFDIGGHRSVVQTSFNDTNVQLRLYNNMVRVAGDTKLYDYYLAYWKRLKAKSWQGWTSDDDRKHLGSLGTKAYVFPRKHTDPVNGILHNVTACRHNDAKIYVAESIFHRKNIKARLAYLHTKLHCNVKVITQQADDEKFVQTKLSNGNNLPNSHVRHIKLHHKFVMIDAKYNGHWQRVVVTGSHNLSYASLEKNDEAMLRVHNVFVYNQFHQHFLDMYKIAAGG